jgi:hypothetical protein
MAHEAQQHGQQTLVDQVVLGQQHAQGCGRLGGTRRGHGQGQQLLKVLNRRDCLPNSAIVEAIG